MYRTSMKIRHPGNAVTQALAPILTLVLVFLCVCEEYEHIVRENCVGVMQETQLLKQLDMVLETVRRFRRYMYLVTRQML